MAQKQTTKPPEKKEETKPVEPKDIKNKKLSEDTDALMEEIDEILEVNCEEFVRNYVQRGGE